MKKNILLLLIVISYIGITKAQVGINITTAKTTLHVVPTKTDGSTTEGIIAPNLTRAQLISKDAKYTGAETGASIYVTDLWGTTTAKTAKVTKAGYYYYDGSLWQPYEDGVVAARNALEKTAGVVELGVNLIKNTTIGQGIYQLNFTGTGGINIANPVNFDGKATINDVLYIPANAGVGKVLTSDPVGNANWVEATSQFQTVVHTKKDDGGSGEMLVQGTNEANPTKIVRYSTAYIDNAKTEFGLSYGWDEDDMSYVVPKTGLYRVSYAVYFRPNGSSVPNQRAYIHKNGVRFHEAGLISVTTNNNDVAGYTTALIRLNKDDTVDLRVYTDARGTVAPVRYFTDVGHTYIMVEFLR